MTHDDPMPDFGAALEARLRTAALAQAAASTPRPAGHEAVDPVAAGLPSSGATRPSYPRRRAGSDPRLDPYVTYRDGLAWRRPFAAVGLVLVAVGVILGLYVSVRPPSAISGPEILNAPRVTNPTYLRRLFGNSSRLGPGSGADLQRVRSFRAPGGTAYLVPTARGWCLRVPDPRSEDPELEYGLSCRTDAEFRRVGIATQVGPTFVGAVAEGVRAPTLTLPDGTVRTARTDRLGVAVTQGAAVGAVYRQYARRGPPLEWPVHPAGGGTGREPVPARRAPTAEAGRVGARVLRLRLAGAASTLAARLLPFDGPGG